MKITKEWLNKNNACLEGIEYCEEKRLIGLPAEEFIEKLIEAKKLDWANWLVAHSLGKIDKVRYAVFAAESVLPIYEENYQNDDRPRKAIEAAKTYIGDPCTHTARAAHAATAAAHAAAYAVCVAADAAYAAIDAADAAYAAATAARAAYAADAANDAARAARAARAANDAARAAHAAYAAYAADAARAARATDAKYIEIIRYGIDLLKEDK